MRAIPSTVSGLAAACLALLVAGVVGVAVHSSTRSGPGAVVARAFADGRRQPWVTVHTTTATTGGVELLGAVTAGPGTGAGRLIAIEAGARTVIDERLAEGHVYVRSATLRGLELLGLPARAVGTDAGRWVDVGDPAIEVDVRQSLSLQRLLTLTADRFVPVAAHPAHLGTEPVTAVAGHLAGRPGTAETLYLTTDADPLPVELVMADSVARFSAWGTPADVAVPTGAVSAP